jgi:undecaprenyl-diphosphatase
VNLLTFEQLKKASTILLILAAVVVIGMGIFVHYHSVLQLDVFLSRDLQSEGSTPEERTAIYHLLYFVSIFGRPLIAGIIVLISAVTFFALKYYRETIFCLLVPISAVINFVVKIAVDRPRPTASLVQILDRELDQSFPSGHVVFYTVFFGFIIASMFFVEKIPKVIRLAVMAFCGFLIITVSFSRVYLGAHWVSDVVAGYFLGGILLWILLHYYLKPHRGREL